MKPTAILTLVVLLCSAAAAQTFVVDANNGPGASFTSIATAVAAVPDGAVLEVRAGAYDSFAIQNKSLTVLCDPGTSVTATGFFANAFASVSDLAATQSVTIAGLSFSGLLVTGIIACVDCAGTVVIDRCAIGSSFGPMGRVQATNCDNVVVRDCVVESREIGPGAIRCVDSNMLLSGCDIDGESFAIRLGGGRVHVTDSMLASTPQNIQFATAVCVLAGGELVLNGSTRLSSTASTPQPAAVGNGFVALDPSTVFSGLTSPPFDPNLTVTTRPIPRLTASRGLLGGVANASLAVPIGGSGVLCVGFAGGPAAVPGVTDPIWLQTGAVLEALGSGPVLAGAYAVPNAPWVVGVQIAWQGVVLEPNGAVRASNAAVYTHY